MNHPRAPTADRNRNGRSFARVTSERVPEMMGRTIRATFAAVASIAVSSSTIITLDSPVHDRTYDSLSVPVVFRVTLDDLKGASDDSSDMSGLPTTASHDWEDFVVCVELDGEVRYLGL